MRDPQGFTEILNDQIRRNLYKPLPCDHLIYKDVFASLIADGLLVPLSWESETQATSPRIPFITYPYEWCNAQFVDAAEITLEISEKILHIGWELKDASAWNVIFIGCKPIFCDHLSFDKIITKSWPAFSQMVKHFILPLSVAKICCFNANNFFKIDRDGVSPEVAKSLIGLKRFVTRYWPLMVGFGSSVAQNSIRKSPERQLKNSHHLNLYALSKWFLQGALKKKYIDSAWISYTSDRGHYTKGASKMKYQAVHAWIKEVKPSWVLDLGCNTGEFSRLAADLGAKVIAIDSDHEAIQELYLSSKGLENIFPVLANMDDFSGGRGWGGDEFKSLLTRLEGLPDLVLMLAVIHHLAISSSVPYLEIVKLAATLTRRYLIVEFLSEEDPMVRHLAAQHGRSCEEFSIKNQIQAFEHSFTRLKLIKITDSYREMWLMEKR